ncbi:DUF285 domain-containing protein, partial [Membranicola marinus]
MNNRISILACLMFLFGIHATTLTAQGEPFIITVKTDNPGTSNPSSFTIPTNNSYTYLYEVDWDNDGVYDDQFVTGDITHDYGTPGVYTIRIRGLFPAIYFNDDGDEEKLLTVEQWGDIQWESFQNAFDGAENLTTVGTDAPDLSNVTDVSRMFDDAYMFCGEIGHWDMSNITNMRGMFDGARVFNSDISNWDVSNVTEMDDVFEDAFLFNQDIGNWDVSSAVDMKCMFEDARSFNQDIGGWDVSNVTDMGDMFKDAYVFNQDIGGWDVSNVTDMDEMFENAYEFNQNLGNWDISGLNSSGDMNQMLDDCGMSMGNYHATLAGWAALPNTPLNMSLGADNLMYCSWWSARDELINTYGWSINGDVLGSCFPAGSNEDVGAAPNCSNFSPAINEKGEAMVTATDFITNIDDIESSPTVTVYNQWGGVLPGFPFTFTALEDVLEWDVCAYLGKTLQFSVTNGAGTCDLGYINLNGAPGVGLTSAFGNQKPWLGDDAADGKINVYCGQIPDPSAHVPTTTTPCGGQASVPKVQPDWVMTIPCDEVNDTAEVIFRTWESYDKDGNLSTLTDTIVVFRLPKLTPDAFIAASEEEYYCSLEATPNTGESLKRYIAWKQPVGLHDYERPYAKLRGVTYEIPVSVIALGLLNAILQGEEVFYEYLNCVILRKSNGEEVTIGDIVTGDYIDDLIASMTDEQKTYGFLQLLIEQEENPYLMDTEMGLFGFYPYLLLQDGDWVMSDGGSFVQVTQEWFYNGHGNNPFWFSGGWPSIYGSDGCISYCDVESAKDLDCIKVRVPALTIEEGITFPGDGQDEESNNGCQIICLPTGVHCGITIKQDPLTGWTGSCPQTRGVDSWITQTCWAETPNWCAEGGIGTAPIPCELISADDNPDDAVVDYECTDKSVKIHLSQWQTLIDTIGPIFDFCYPIFNLGDIFDEIINGFENDDCNLIGPWDQEEIMEAIRSGEQYETAQRWEACNPTVYRVGTHDCSVAVYVPSVKVIDNCSGIHSVKAMVEVAGGTRAVALEQTAVETQILANGDTCYVYTYAHTTDPIEVPFSGCDGELTEVRYEAADNCWNQSEWSKFIHITDDVPPTVVVNRNLNVTLTNKIAWVPAENWDEGSWDNCEIDLRLGRRTDWWADTACVDLCADLGPNAPYDNWVDLLDDLGVAREHAAGAVAGERVGETYFNALYNVNDLKTFLDDGEVEKYYFHQIQWLWEDEELCGEKVVHAWIYAIAEYIAENCSEVDDHGNPLDINDLEAIFDNLSGQPGYGNELALMGGGWGKSVPFKCEDACESVPVELLVLDYCCNWGIGRSVMNVEDDGNARVVRRLPDLDITCESYNIFYKDVVEAAAAFGENGSVIDTAGAFDEINDAFGSYILTWVDNQNRPTDIDGNLLPDSIVNFDYWNIACEEKSEIEKVAIDNHDGTIGWETIIHNTTFLDTTTLTEENGVVAINCSGSYTQDIWVDLDECGQGTLTRRFFVVSDCGEEPQWVVEQVINVQSACGMRASMFDLPANVGTKNEPICLPEGLSQSYLPDTIGALTLKSHLEGKLCNSFASGSNVKEFDVAGTDMKKYVIEWTMIDWCAHHTSSNREFSYTQEVIATIDPECDVTTGTGDTTDVSLVQGTIATERGEAVQKVEMKAVLGSGSPLTTVTGGEGAYNFSISNGA